MPSLTIVRAPLRATWLVGENVTVMVQLPPIASVAPQLFVCAKSIEVVIDEIASGADPKFLIVIICGALFLPATTWPYARLVVDRDTIPATPLPVSGTVWGLPNASCTTVSKPEADTFVAGAYEISIEQLAPAARLVPHAFC